VTENLTSLTVPGAFVLLLQKPNGARYRNSMAPPIVAAAEVGELALRERVSLEDKKIHLLDASPVGVPWMDEALAKIDAKTGGGSKPHGVFRWVSLRGNGIIRKHREVLGQRQVLEPVRETLLGVVPRNRYVPDEATRDGVLDELRRAARGGEVDDRLAVLCSLVHASNAAPSLGFDKQQRARLKEISRSETLGKSVQQTVAVLTAVALAAAAASSAGS